MIPLRVILAGGSFAARMQIMGGFEVHAVRMSIGDFERYCAEVEWSLWKFSEIPPGVVSDERDYERMWSLANDSDSPQNSLVVAGEGGVALITFFPLGQLCEGVRHFYCEGCGRGIASRVFAERVTKALAGLEGKDERDSGKG